MLSSLVISGASATDGGGNSLVDHVCAANSRFADVTVAVAEGYAPIPLRERHRWWRDGRPVRQWGISNAGIRTFLR